MFFNKTKKTKVEKPKTLNGILEVFYTAKNDLVTFIHTTRNDIKKLEKEKHDKQTDYTTANTALEHITKIVPNKRT